MSVSLQKIAGVDSVKVSLKAGRATLVLQPKNSVRLEQVRQQVREKGFTPKEARVAARGELLFTEGKFQFNVLGTNETYEAVVGPQTLKSSEEISGAAGTIVLLEGTVPPPQKGVAALLQLQDFRQIP